MLDAAARGGVEGARLLGGRADCHVQLLHAGVLLLYLVDAALQLLRGPYRVDASELTAKGT